MSLQIRRRIPTSTLRQRMAACAVIVLAFLFLISILFLAVFQQSETAQVQSLYNVLSSELNRHIGNSVKMLYDSSMALSYSKTVQGALYANSPSERFSNLLLARDTISNYETILSGVLNVRFFNQNGSNVAVDASYHALEEAALAEMPFSDKPQFSKILTPGSGDACFIYFTPCKNALFHASPNAHACSCAILYSLDPFINGSLFQRGETNHLSIYDGRHIPLRDCDAALSRQFAELGEGVHHMTIDGTPCVVYGFFIEPTGWLLSYALPRGNVLSDATSLYKHCFFWMILGAAAVLAFILYHLLYISSSIQLVTRSVTNAGDDDIIESSRLPEMQLLTGQLNQLLRRIAQVNETNALAQRRAYDAEIAKNRAELAFYRTQISPHFLFNTLECIRSMARHSGAESVDGLIQATSQVLQYSLYSGTVVPLRDELENAHNYMELMNRRSLNAYRYKERVDPAALDHPMVSMILQPLLENSILHGQRDVRRRTLTISLRVDLLAGEDLLIRIVDNGRGMSDELLQSLRYSIDHIDELSFKDNIGISNVAKRLKLANRDCEIMFAARPGHYTSITLRIPSRLDP